MEESEGFGRGKREEEEEHGNRTNSKVKGWSSLTRLLRNPSPPRDPFPPLTNGVVVGSNGNTTSNGGSTAAAAAKNHHQQRQHRHHYAQVVPSNSGGGGGDRSQQQQQQQQQQRGISPASSTGSFSSNYSGRNNHHHHWGEGGGEVVVQPAFSSNGGAGAVGGQQQLAGSPPESSSGSFAPNNSHARYSTAENNKNGVHSRGSGRAGSSAGSLHPYGGQSGVYDGRGGGAFRQVFNGRGEGEVRGVGDGDEFDVSRRSGQEMTSAVERDGNGGARPAVSDGRSSIGDAEKDFNGAREQGRDAADSTAASALHVPMEPEWEEEDLYLRVRADALKEARARDRFAKGASQAYVRGDHRKAKSLAKQAQEKRVIAEKLHAEAAFEIFNRRNNASTSDIWHLDLHGLHSSEAVAALESRLALLEHGLVEDHKLRLLSSASQFVEAGQGHSSAPEGEAEVPNGVNRIQDDSGSIQLFQSLIPSSKLLSIVTGIGSHSHGGATLPSAVKTYLINNGYQLEEARAGVVSVHPKLRFFA